MIQAKEIRIGNYLFDDTNRYFQVKLIGEKCLHSYGGFIYDLDDVNPIPLTEEILLKSEGIIKHPTIKNRYIKHPITKNRYLLEDSKYSFHIEDGDWDNPSLDVLIGGRYIICVKFLHTFQNLMYALTNQELNIEL